MQNVQVFKQSDVSMFENNGEVTVASKSQLDKKILASILLAASRALIQ